MSPGFASEFLACALLQRRCFAHKGPGAKKGFQRQLAPLSPPLSGSQKHLCNVQHPTSLNIKWTHPPYNSQSAVGWRGHAATWLGWGKTPPSQRLGLGPQEGDSASELCLELTAVCVSLGLPGGVWEERQASAWPSSPTLGLSSKTGSPGGRGNSCFGIFEAILSSPEMPPLLESHRSA